LAYHGQQPVGWCAVAPRQDFPALGRSRILKPVDDQAVWSVTCFFIARGYRRKGLATMLLRTAVNYAHEQGAKIIEGYPIDSRTKSIPDVFAWTGLATAFRKVGFKEVARRSPTRPLMRKTFRD
jgi:GNAT superfamily N-acetyltransferase